jgi:hypothetical protein
VDDEVAADHVEAVVHLTIAIVAVADLVGVDADEAQILGAQAEGRDHAVERHAQRGVRREAIVDVCRIDLAKLAANEGGMPSEVRSHTSASGSAVVARATSSGVLCGSFLTTPSVVPSSPVPAAQAARDTANPRPSQVRDIRRTLMHYLRLLE